MFPYYSYFIILNQAFDDLRFCFLKKKTWVSVTDATRVKKSLFLQYFYTTALFIKISIELVIFLSHL